MFKVFLKSYLILFLYPSRGFKIFGFSVLIDTIEVVYEFLVLIDTIEMVYEFPVLYVIVLTSFSFDCCFHDLSFSYVMFFNIIFFHAHMLLDALWLSIYLFISWLARISNKCIFLCFWLLLGSCGIDISISSTL